MDAEVMLHFVRGRETLKLSFCELFGTFFLRGIWHIERGLLTFALES
jgi:hypothetical protein